MKNAKLKPLYLYDIFLEKTDEFHPMSVPELTQELILRGVPAERKGVYRDIEALQAYGADIVQSAKGYYLNARRFSERELRALALAVEAAPFISARRQKELLQKLFALSGTHMAEMLEAELSCFAPKSEDDAQLLTLETASLCIGASRQLTFLHFEEDGGEKETRRYRVNPYALLSLGGGMLLVANAEGEEGLREFDLSRASGARMEMQPRVHIAEVSPFKAGFSFAAYLLTRG